MRQILFLIMAIGIIGCQAVVRQRLETPVAVKGSEEPVGLDVDAERFAARNAALQPCEC